MHRSIITYVVRCCGDREHLPYMSFSFQENEKNTHTFSRQKPSNIYWTEKETQLQI